MAVCYLFSNDLSGDSLNSKSLSVELNFFKALLAYLGQKWSVNLICLRQMILCFWSIWYVLNIWLFCTYCVLQSFKIPKLDIIILILQVKQKKIQVTERPSNLLKISELVSARPEL